MKKVIKQRADGKDNDTNIKNVKFGRWGKSVKHTYTNDSNSKYARNLSLAYYISMCLPAPI